jgi:hypothetical protein
VRHRPDGVSLEAGAFELRPQRGRGGVHRPGGQPARVVAQARDHDVGARHIRRSLDDRRERRLEPFDTGCFPGHGHPQPPRKYGLLDSPRGPAGATARRRGG